MPLRITSRADDADKHEFDVTQIIAHKGKVYSAGDDGKVKVWADDLKFLQEIQAHPCSIYSLTASDDTLYTCSNDGTVKSWDINTLKEKQVLIKDEETEFWKVVWSNGVLYIGDNQGNIRIYKNDVLFGLVNLAVPIKDLVVKESLVLASKDADVIATDLQLDKDKPIYTVKATISGRGPLALIDNKSIFLTREGKDLIVNEIGEHQIFNEIAKTNGAHEMIVNGAAAVNWDGKILIFTGGWDKVVKQWKLDNNSIQEELSAPVEFVINAITAGEKGLLYVGGGDGHIVRLEL